MGDCPLPSSNRTTNLDQMSSMEVPFRCTFVRGRRPIRSFEFLRKARSGVVRTVADTADSSARPNSRQAVIAVNALFCRVWPRSSDSVSVCSSATRTR